MWMRFLLVVFLAACTPVPDAQAPSQIDALLRERNKEFKPEVIQVSESVYTAVGFGLSPVSMVIGNSGLIIIDTNLDPASGEKVLSEFRKITDKSVAAIIFTHGHGDHTGGAISFMDDDTQIWARKPFRVEDQSFAKSGLQQAYQTRGYRQFGVMVPEEGIEHVGITPRYFPAPAPNRFHKPVQPTQTFADENEIIDIAGIKLELVAADGETDDQLFVWFEKEGVIFAGDNFYKSWPNLYPIRGTAYRDVQAWINSLGAMLEKKPDHLVGGHTRPILGKAKVNEVLTNYHGAVKYVYDKSIEGMNKGLTPDELVEYAKLPEKYRELDYLRPYYGHPDWGVRSIFSGHLGWFDGNPTQLFPLTPVLEAENIVKLAGGERAVRKTIDAAKAEENYQWALQLLDYLIRLSPDESDLLLQKAEILDARAKQELNVTARNYYRSYAFELRQKVKLSKAAD